MAERFDVIVRGARVLDPATDFDGIADIAIADGRIAAIGPALTRAAARELQAHGLIAMPGLVDLHTHVYPDGSYWGIHPDRIGAASGVTTWVDAGSSGAYSIDAMRRICRDYRINVRAFLHISGIGLTGCAGESVIDANLDTDAARAAITRHADFVCGVKVRMDRTSVGSNGLTPLAKAIEVAGDAGLPVMAHIGPAPPTAVEVTEMLRPGDILTHCWSPRASWQQDGGSDPTPPTAAQLRHLSQRGVLLDIGHGASSFSFAIAEQMASSGVWPDTISTDVHVNSVDGPVHDLPTTMTKLMELGMPLMDVVRAATQTPARVARLARGRGSLTVGGVADLAVFSLEDERFDMVDSGNEVRTAQRRLRAITTFASGVEWT